jgi:predicted RNA binding protein YcfA (HicA-like mRNA interferase family)
MVKNLNSWNFRDVVKFLKKNGFVHHRTKGSHFHYKKITGDKTFLVVVAFHGNRNVPVGTMNSIIRQSGIDKEEWV